MQFFQPQVKLIRQSTANSSIMEYFLHAVTITDRANYRAGDPIIQNAGTSNGSQMKVILPIFAAEDVPDFVLNTPVVHVAYLGELPYSPEGVEGSIRVEVVKINSSNTTETTVDPPVGGSTATTIDAQEISRPIVRS